MCTCTPNNFSPSCAKCWGESACWCVQRQHKGLQQYLGSSAVTLCQVCCQHLQGALHQPKLIPCSTTLGKPCTRRARAGVSARVHSCNAMHARCSDRREPECTCIEALLQGDLLALLQSLSEATLCVMPTLGEGGSGGMHACMLVVVVSCQQQGCPHVVELLLPCLPLPIQLRATTLGGSSGSGRGPRLTAVTVPHIIITSGCCCVGLLDIPGTHCIIEEGLSRTSRIFLLLQTVHSGRD